ncbi:hypothetical protein AB0I27_22855 [Streptomyces sp. NPDC050597]|uniref:hypothetical protein n=1 Tax=Streptomyces sp. NPDC050597 TaxID=3157212 RepID=UPI00342CAC28
MTDSLRLAHQARRAKEHQLDDIRRALCDIGFMQEDDPYSHADLADVIRQNGPAATEATQPETTARVFAGLHHSAEQDVTRVINLYERWVKAGPPPLGVSLSRWWDRRLVELHQAIHPPAEQPRTVANNPATSGDAANNQLRQQIAEAIEADADRPSKDRVGIINAILPVIDRETAQLRRERDMALKAAREARGDVAHDSGPSVAECRDNDRAWDVEQEAP